MLGEVDVLAELNAAKNTDLINVSIILCYIVIT